MAEITPSEIDEIDILWRQCPTDHVWAGWARPGNRSDEVWIFRRRANWRRFTLIKRRAYFYLYDEKHRIVARAPALSDLLKLVDAIPGLNDPLAMD